MTHSTKTISPLRQRMLDDMAMRKLKPKTQIAYIRAVRKLSQFLGRLPAQATSEDLRRFRLHLVAAGISSVMLNNNCSTEIEDIHNLEIDFKGGSVPESCLFDYSKPRKR